MKTVQEMLQFAERYQNVDLKQYKAAFKEIEKELIDYEPVIFAMTGSTYALNEMPMMWHVALALTKSRMIIGGERMKGMLMTSYTVQSFPVCEILSVSEADMAMGSMLVIRTRQDELKIEVENHEVLKEIIQELKASIE